MKPSLLSSFLNSHNLFTHIRREENNFYSLTIGDINRSDSFRLAIQLLDFTRAKIGIQADAMEPSIQGTFAVPGVQVWLTRSFSRLPAVLDSLIRKVKHRYCIEYAVGAYADRDGHQPDLVVHWNFGMDPDSWSSKESKVRRNTLWVRDTFQGKQHIDTIHSENFPVVIPLPEGPLDATLTIDRCVRWRAIGPAVPFTTMSFKFSRPVPICDHKDREWTGSGAKGSTIEEAVANMAAAIVSRRLRNNHTPDGKRSLHNVLKAAKQAEQIPAELTPVIISDLAAFVGHLRKSED